MTIILNENKYNYLEFYRKEDIPYIIGTNQNLRVDDIYIFRYKTCKLKPEYIARERRLSLEAVLQAIQWCEENRQTLREELAIERKRAGLKD